VFSIYALSLALLIPPTSDQELVSLTPQESLLQPFVELLQVQNIEGEFRAEIKALRSRLMDERDQKLQELKLLERDWNEKLDSARQQLQLLNKQGSADTETASKRRSVLHIEIASLERVIREKAIEREHTIPAAYELQLTKLWLVEHWPDRRASADTGMPKTLGTGPSWTMPKTTLSRAEKLRVKWLRAAGFRVKSKTTKSGATCRELRAESRRILI
jgi:hypothetical protein